MLNINSQAEYYLKRTRAMSKEIEFSVPDNLKAKQDVNIDELFPVTIACIADLCTDILREEISVYQIKEYSSRLYFASKFYDAYLNIDNSNECSNGNYFLLVGAIAYYLCDNVGSSLVLANRIKLSGLHLCNSQLDILLCSMLQNKTEIVFEISDFNIFKKYILEFINEYNALMKHGNELNKKFVKTFRRYVYENGTDRDVFFIDSLLTIFVLKNEYSIFNLLPKYSSIPKNVIKKIVDKNCFVKEMWPAQRYMCELNLFNGMSGVVQMPTGTGKTKSIAIAIYSVFYSQKTNLSIVIAPFRALCRAITRDLESDLSFDNNIHINQISDLLQIDFIFDELFDSKEKTVIVTTPEKFLYLLRQDSSITNNIGQIIFDEGHLFDDPTRGATYELLIASILAKLSPTTQKILISAIIPNVDEINRWFTSGDGIAFSGSNIATVDKLPSVLGWVYLEKKFYCYLYYLNKDGNTYEPDFYVPRIIEIETLNNKPKEYTKKFFPSVNFDKGEMKEKNDMAIACLLKFVGGANTAVFCGRKDSANNILKRIIDLYERKYDISPVMKNADKKEIYKLSNQIEKNYGKSNIYYTASLLGVYVHHSGVTDGIRNAIEFALKKSLISNVICTSTLAQGVNLPIKYLIVSSIYQSTEQIKVRDFHNLIGRTGRPGMFTEGTIVFSDPFVYKNKRNARKWDKYKQLLDVNNSEKCGSVLLDLVTKKDGEIDKLKLSEWYYSDKNQILQFLEKDSTQPKIKEMLITAYNTTVKTLTCIEGYITNIISEHDNINIQKVINEMIENTLAYSIATDEQKKDLKTLFELILQQIEKKLTNISEKKVFSKSLISIDDFLSLKQEVTILENTNFEETELLCWFLKIFIKYGSTKLGKKIENLDHIVMIAKMWMDGKSYSCILENCNSAEINIYKRNKYYPISLEDIIEICDSDFGYSSSIIINSICEILSQIDDTFSQTIDTLHLIESQLKYGLHNKTEMLVFELGFNDRYISKEISNIIGTHITKHSVKGAIKRNYMEINGLLKDFPSVYQTRLSNLH